MDQNHNTPEFHALPILNFRFFNPAAMQSLAKDLRLVLSAPALFHMQHVYRTRELRDPTVGELKLLNAFALLWHKMPGSATIAEIAGDGQQQRILRDVMQKWSAMSEQAPPTLPQMMDLLPRYLARSGIRAHTDALYAGTPQELASLAGGRAPRLSLSMGSTAAMLMHEPLQPVHPMPQGMLLLLTATEERTLAEEAERLFAALPQAPLLPLAAPMQEGLLPHLLSLSGVTLHANAIPGYTEESSPADLVTLGRNTLLLQAPEQLIPSLLAIGAPIKLIGTTVPTGRLTLIRGAQTQLTLPLALLRELCAVHPVKPTLQQPQTHEPAPLSFVQDDNALLGGAAICGDAESALFAFLREAAERGADPSKTTLSATLELPLGADLGTALPPVLAYHRAAAELALPAIRHRQISTDVAAPRLCIYLAATCKQPRALTDVTDWQTLRNRLYAK